LANTEQSAVSIKQDNNINIVQICANSTYSNITSGFIDGLNSQLINLSTSMTQTSTDTYSYVFNSTDVIGTYYFYGICDQNGVKTTWGLSYQVTPAGQELTSAKSTAYVLIFVIGFLLWLGIFLLGIYLPSGNTRDEMTGYILYVNNIKYLKFFLIELSFVLATVLSYFAWMFSYAYLDFNFITSLLSVWFYIMITLTIVGFPLVMYFTIANLIRDSEIGDALLRGLHIR
jgi:hypothetical protein